MIILLIALMCLLAAGLLARWVKGFRLPPLLFLAPYFPSSRRPSAIALANVAEGENLYGQKTYISDIVIATRYLLAKIGSAQTNITTTGVGDRPIGVIADAVTTALDPVVVNLFGARPGTSKVSVNSVVNPGDYLVPDANGYAMTLPAANGTYWVFGQAANLTASVAGDIIEFIPTWPRRIVLAGGVQSATF
jgi:hypothetical protein